MFEHDPRKPSRWRTRAAIEAAIAAGIVVGLFDIQVGTGGLAGGILILFVSFSVGGIGSAILCALATDRHLAVGVGYAGSLATTAVIAGRWEEWTTAVYGFVFIFLVLGSPALLVSLFCAYLKWAELWD
jgi:hypothetical protein